MTALRTKIRKTRKAFEDAVGPVKDHPVAYERYTGRADVIDMPPEESNRWALECHELSKRPVQYVTDKQPVRRHGSFGQPACITDALEALHAMGQQDTDRLKSELAYGRALRDLETLCDNHRQYGDRIKEGGLDWYETSQLGTIKRVEIKRDTRIACVWLAEHYDEARAMLADPDCGATTARGLHEKWKAAPATQAPKAAPAKATPQPLPELSMTAQQKLDAYKRRLDREFESRANDRANELFGEWQDTGLGFLRDEVRSVDARLKALLKSEHVLKPDDYTALKKVVAPHGNPSEAARRKAWEIFQKMNVRPMTDKELETARVFEQRVAEVS